MKTIGGTKLNFFGIKDFSKIFFLFFNWTIFSSLTGYYYRGLGPWGCFLNVWSQQSQYYHFFDIARAFKLLYVIK